MTAKKKPSLTPKQQRFVQEYLIDLNATQAAIRAGYSAKTAKVIASENLTKPDVAAALASAMADRKDRLIATSDDVVKELLSIAVADVRELVEFRRCCCRFCWGEDNRYQRTKGEMERDRQEWEKRNTDLIEAGKPGIGEFDEKGGTGFNPKKDPSPTCPECFGDGVGQTFIHDTRKLSAGAARLYAGIKETKEGFEVKTLSQDAAIVNLGRHFGSFKDKVEHTGLDGGPMQFTLNDASALKAAVRGAA